MGEAELQGGEALCETSKARSRVQKKELNFSLSGIWGLVVGCVGWGEREFVGSTGMSLVQRLHFNSNSRMEERLWGEREGAGGSMLLGSSHCCSPVGKIQVNSSPQTPHRTWSPQSPRRAHTHSRYDTSPVKGMEPVVAQAAAPTLLPSPELGPQQEDTGEGHGVGSWVGHFGTRRGWHCCLFYWKYISGEVQPTWETQKETNAPFQRFILIIFFPLDFIEISPLQIAGSWTKFHNGIWILMWR